MRLLVTGGCGFLGTNLVAEALVRGACVTVLDDFSREGSNRNLAWLRARGPFEVVHGDIRDPRTVAECLKASSPDLIFHLAGQVAMTVSLANPRLDFEVNALGTLNILEAMRAHAPTTVLVYASTNKVYGDLGQYACEERPTRYVCPRWPRGFDETVPLSFESPYGCSKGAADQYVLDYARVFGLRTVVFRHSSMYGGRQFATIDQGWVGWFCRQAAELRANAFRRPFTICGTGKQVRDILYVDDVVRLYFAVPDCLARAAGRAFNIGGGMDNSLSLLELFALLEELGGVRMAYERLPPRVGDQPVFVADVSLAARAFDWSPRVTARQGVTAMFEWATGEQAVGS